LCTITASILHGVVNGFCFFRTLAYSSLAVPSNGLPLQERLSPEFFYAVSFWILSRVVACSRFLVLT